MIRRSGTVEEVTLGFLGVTKVTFITVTHVAHAKLVAIPGSPVTRVTGYLLICLLYVFVAATVVGGVTALAKVGTSVELRRRWYGVAIAVVGFVASLMASP
jgi:hypothetical protein